MSDKLTIAQVSDTHLSRTHSWFTGNWPVFLDEMRALSPDFIVNSGDLSFNGPAHSDDLVFARLCHDLLPAPWRAIAGNHDVGEAPSASRLDQPVNDQRLAAWDDIVGPSWWYQDLDCGKLRLRMIGLDTALMGSGHSQEGLQVRFLETTLSEADGATIVVFTHMPPFGDDPDELTISTSHLLPEPRHWLLSRCVEAGVSAIAAGHIHTYSTTTYRGIKIVTAPATSFVSLSKAAAEKRNAMRTGYLIWHFDEGGLWHELIRPRLFMSIDASNWTEQSGTTTTLPARPLRDETCQFPAV